MELNNVPAMVRFRESCGYTFGKRILNIRKLRGRSQQWLSEASGVSVPTIIKIESGRGNPGYETIISVALALEVHPAYLLLQDNDVHPDREFLFSNIMAGVTALAGVADARVEYEDELTAIRDGFVSIMEKEKKRNPEWKFMKD